LAGGCRPDLLTYIGELRAKESSPAWVRSYAVREGYIGENPLRRLEAGDRPKLGRTPKRILEPDEVDRLLSPAGSNRTLLASAIWTGLRQSELLGLTWGDLDFDAGLIRVRKRLSRKSRERKSLKTDAAQLDVILSPSLARLLREHKAASRFKAPTDYVFCSVEGKPLHWSNVDKRALHRAFGKAKLREPRPRWHDLRHTFASALIAAGADVGFLSTQLGHASPDITLGVLCPRVPVGAPRRRTQEPD
jgi:integrase